MTPSHILDELTYRSYCHNRRLGITPAGFRLMGFPGDITNMEERFQYERITAMRDAVQATKRTKVCPCCKMPHPSDVACKPGELRDNGPTIRHMSEHP